MPWKKGQSGNPNGIGIGKEKLFRTALIMELKSVGEDMPELRRIARNVIDEARDRASNQWFACAKELWDRIDGKAPMMVTDKEHEFKKALDLTDDELDAIIESGRRRGILPGGADEADAPADTSELH